MAVSELAWDLEKDPRAEQPSQKPPPPSRIPRVDVEAAVANEVKEMRNRTTPSKKPPPPVPRPAVPRVRVLAPTNAVFDGCLTKRITQIDQRLLAIARGEVDPESGTHPIGKPLAPHPCTDLVPTRPVPPRFASAAEHHAVELCSEPPRSLLVSTSPSALASSSSSSTTRSSNGVATLDDPFGGLIPVNDDGDVIEVDDTWLEGAEEPEPFSIR